MIIKIEDFDFDNTLFDEKSYKNIFIYKTSSETLGDAKPLRIRFNKVDGFSINLVLFGPGKYDAIYNRIRYLIRQKSGITYVFPHNYIKIKLIRMILYL